MLPINPGSQNPNQHPPWVDNPEETIHTNEGRPNHYPPTDTDGPRTHLPDLVEDWSTGHYLSQSDLVSWLACPLHASRNIANQPPFLDLEFDLNDDYNSSSNSELHSHPDFSLFPDLPPLDESADFNQIFSSCESSAWTDPSQPTFSPPETLSTALSRSVPSDSPSASDVPRDSTWSTSTQQSAPARQRSEARKTLAIASIAISRPPGWTCSKCSEIFSSQILLDRHFRHHDEFICARGCGTTCKSEKDLQRHDDYIHGNKKLECHLCAYKGRKDGLKRHMKVHEPSANSKHGKRKRLQEGEPSTDNRKKMQKGFAVAYS